MSDDPADPEDKRPKKPADDRKARVAEALRANLRRRKQAAGRRDGAHPGKD